MKQQTDVLIIGSGASGGMAAHTLTKLGAKCVMLDAGPLIDPEKQKVLRPVSDLPYRGFGKPGRFPHVTQANEFSANMWADEKLNPYTYDPADPYYWVRIRLIGGKTLAWGRASWRLSDYEFKCKDHDGFGDNWPIAYKDLAPFYDRVEPIFRVSGRKEGFDQIPDGNFLLDESKDSECVKRFLESCRKSNVPTTKQRRSTGTLASSLNLLIPAAMETGNLTLVPNAVVRELSYDRKTGRVTGAHFVDRISKREYHITAKAVIVGASTLESTRILLNSNIANSSGTLGHYLFDQFYVKNVVQAVVPEARGGKASRSLMGGGGYIPRFRNLKSKEKNFIRGYAYDFGSGGSLGPQYFSSYGEDLWKKMADTQGSGFNLTAMGEVLPRKENAVRINKLKTDAWGIPVLHIQHKYTDNEFNMAKDAMNTADELCRASGFEVIAKHWEMVPPGESIHELGTCRMGSDPKTSVLNQWNQSHDVKNLFVVDGSSFVSGGSQNPTLTILALSMRASEYLHDQMKQGAL
ncbi:GMC family oxidoreductase [Bryobacter aggregatus]|uniref:GMC family oxidoreductase n=1 Tax=Bryobacter aggregatus TaxID=360054 RepID=UPI0004E20826|nr:GMC family oxidoreductase [Bryobacter aggregatus]